jgi:hypothetical protein
VWEGKVGFRPAFVHWQTTFDDADLLLETIRVHGAAIDDTIVNVA